MTTKPPLKQNRRQSGTNLIEDKMKILQENGQNTLLNKARAESRGSKNKVEILRVSEQKPYTLSL